MISNAEYKINYDSQTGRLSVNYLQKTIFKGIVTGGKVRWDEISRPAEPVYLGFGHGPEEAGGVPEGREAKSVVVTISGEKASVKGTVYGGRDAFACTPDDGPEIIRSFIGRSRSNLNRGVYDRDSDWALYVAEPAECCVNTLSLSEFEISASGSDIKLVIHQDFYRNHLGYFHWNPCQRELWKEPVSGWCSWAALGHRVSEDYVVAAADFFARELADYGWNIVQIDDGYQRFKQSDPETLKPGEKMADLWTNSNDRFPHGMERLANLIKSKGLTPGIWVSTSLALGMADEWYVKDCDGRPYKGPWVNYAINGAIPEAVEAAFLETIRGLKKQGWEYFKIDTIRHVLYDSYRNIPEYWQNWGITPEEAFRNIFKAIFDEIGEDTYGLSCWGVMPEMAGIPHGCRIGEDIGANWESVERCQRFVAQFNYLNNIIWLNDPDYMCFRLPVEQARTWASFLALTGCQLMVSDPLESYDEPHLDILRKVGPPLYIRPSALRSLPEKQEIWLLDIDKGDEPYSVLGRIAWNEDGLPERNISFIELGLDPEQQYLVHDFWNEEFIGSFRGEFPSAKLAQGECRIYAIRRALDRPQILSTNRHISQGAYELEDVKWEGSTLAGRMKLPPKRPFSIFVYVPDSWELSGNNIEAEQQGNVIKLTLSSANGGFEEWSIGFKKR